MRNMGTVVLSTALGDCASISSKIKTRIPLLLLVLVTASLAGCQNGLERREMADDQTCRKIIAERNDANPQAYEQCRANMRQYRMQAAVRSVGN
jgi:hypothetical protein